MSARRLSPDPLSLDDKSDLQTVLAAWHNATVRLEQTHQSLREEVQELTRELEVKNRELARKNRLADLGQMASHVAHEVRNNLVPATLYLSLLRRRVSDDSGSLDILDKIASGFTTLDVMVNDLLHFTSDRDPHVQTFSMSKLIEEVCAAVAPQLSAQAVETIIDVPRELWVAADRDMFRRAALNMVLNAMDAMPEGGCLTITSCARRMAWSWKSPTLAPGCLSKSCRGYSSRFSPPSRTGPAWGWPLCRGSPKSTAARRLPPTAPMAARPSQSAFLTWRGRLPHDGICR